MDAFILLVSLVLSAVVALFFLKTRANATETSPGSSPARNKARTASESSDCGGTSPKTKASKIVRNIKKKIREALELQQLQAEGQTLDRDQLAKVKRRKNLERELLGAEAQEATELKELAWAKEVLVNEDENRKKEQAKDLAIRFDEKFACPICQEVFESATMIEQCSHIFCRDCALSVVDCSKKCLCPLCRVPFSSKHLKAATSMRKRMAKHTGFCHCGEEVALSQLRAHIRSCDVTVQERPKYNKHQPLSQTESPGTKPRTAQRDYVYESEESAIMQQVMEQSRQEYEWSSIYGNQPVATN